MIYTIKKYKQKSNNLLYKIFDFLSIKNRFSYLVSFKSAPKYINKKKYVRTINRLFGISNIFLNKSICFGWEYFHHEIYIYSYYHYKNKTISRFLQKLKIGETYKMTIFNKKDYFTLTITDSKNNIKQIKIPILESDNLTFNYNLYPRLNGSNISVNNIEIDLIEN